MYQDIPSLGSIANFVYQGEDQFGDNNELRNIAIGVSRNFAKNYKGERKKRSTFPNLLGGTHRH